jgi:hypothetical protein
VTYFKPKFWPDNLIDCTVCLSVLFVQVVFLFAAPAIIIGLLFSSSWTAVLSFCGLWFGFTLFAVKALDVTESGIKFVRTFGSPKFLPWDQIEEISDAKPVEVVWKGQLWPLFPAREMAPCLSCRGHFKIATASQISYFPPKDAAAFRQAVLQFWGQK